MLKNLIRHVETDTGLSPTTARAAIGIIFNAAERQGAPLASKLFSKLPGARPLAAKVGTEIGASTGEIARLFEKTPGGRRYVTSQMLRSLHNVGLGHDAIGKIMPSISSFMKDTYGDKEFGTIGDLLGSDNIYTEAMMSSQAA